MVVAKPPRPSRLRGVKDHSGKRSKSFPRASSQTGGKPTKVPDVTPCMPGPSLMNVPVVDDLGEGVTTGYSILARMMSHDKPSIQGGHISISMCVWHS
jgi:hypothetical protein